MNVTREVIKDLLPLYTSGGGSPDTRALVESFLQSDPELGRLAEAMRDEAIPPTTPPPPDRGRDALARTKTLLRRRTWFLASALFFTGLPFSFVAGGRGLEFLMLRDAPAVGSASVTLALAFWIAFAVTARRLRVSGL